MPATSYCVPPDNPSYQLRRLWIDRPEYDAYYGGFANEGLWPLCHLVDVRPKFRSEDWAAYQTVNARFAAAIDQELPTIDTPVFIQDYHLALVAAELRKRRPAVADGALLAHSVAISGSSSDLSRGVTKSSSGLLANDLLAFQLERDRRNFVLAVREELGLEVEADGERVRAGDRITTITSVPIGVDYDRIQTVGADGVVHRRTGTASTRFGLDAEILGLGVDRLDYTKGIPERLEALDRLFTRQPELRGRLTFVQIGVPSRSSLESYGAIESEIADKVHELNARHGMPDLPPPVYYHRGRWSCRAWWRSIGSPTSASSARCTTG